MTFYHWTHGCDVNVVKNYLNKSAYPKLVIMKSKGTLLFLKKNGGHQSFCGATDLWWCLPWFSKPGWILLLNCLYATDSLDSPMVRHLLTSWQPAWQLGCSIHVHVNTTFTKTIINNTPIHWELFTEIQRLICYAMNGRIFLHWSSSERMFKASD